MGLEELEYKCNYFIGNVPSKWRSDVPNYSAVTMRGLYPGVDVTFSTKDGRLQEVLRASAIGDLAQVKVEYRGAESVTQQTDNLAVVQTSLGEHLFDGILLSNGQESSLSETRSSTTGTSSADPVTLVYSTYLGGGTFDGSAGDIAADASGNAFVTGPTTSTNFPTLNPYQGTLQAGIYDVFVTKLSSSGSALIYSTYLGGGGDELDFGIAIDASGNAFVTGYTSSTDFPTLNPYQTDQGGQDAFVTKLSSSGSALLYSTYLGGGDRDDAFDIAVDASGNAFVTGRTTSTNFPTLNSYQTNQLDWDVFVTKISSSGSALVYSTYLGGTDYDYGFGIAIDASGNAFVTGYTSSTDFPTLNPYQTDQLGVDVFVTKLSSTGNALVYSTYLGGANNDNGYRIAIDASGNCFVTGYTGSIDFPTLNPYQGTKQGLLDAFVTKLSSSGSALLYSTYLGGNGDDYVGGIAIDASGNAFVTGYTESINFPTLNPYQTNQSTDDVFVTKLSSTGSTLLYSTYLGGNGADYGLNIAVDASGSPFVTGYTLSSNFPTLNPYQGTNQGSYDVFVTKLLGSCCVIAGDADGDASVSIADAVYLIGYIFLGGGAPPCPQSGDADSDASISIADAVYLIGYIFLGGPAPVCGP